MFRSVFLIISFLYIIDMLLLVPKYVRCKYDHTPRKRKLFWKGACIGLPFLILAFGTLVICISGYAKGNYSYLLVTAGMLFCAVGDITLDVRFSVGGIFFGIGHLDPWSSSSRASGLRPPGQSQRTPNVRSRNS